MASIFKRSKRKNEPYTIQYVDHQGKRRTTLGFTDKGLSEQLAAKLENEARLRQTGLIDTEQERLVAVKQSPLEDHLKAFQESLADNTANYVRQTINEVRRVVAGTGFQTLADLAPEPVQIYLRALRKDNGFGHRTYNHYLQSLDTFCYWCVSTKRLTANPLAGIERLNVAVDVRHARRALSVEEFSKMVASARASGISIQYYSGEQRARIYITSYMTGLRKKELASLTRKSFALDTSLPTVTVEAAYSKHRRKDVLPLHPEFVSMLREWLNGKSPSDKLFPKLDRRKTWVMVKKDLERVGIPYETPEGIADFHAAGRHTHITELLRNGASLVEAKELARHSDIKTTMRYTHIGIKDQARAVATLLAPKAVEEPAPVVESSNSVALHGRCISGVSEEHEVSSDGSGPSSQKRQNPCGRKGFGVNCQPSSSDGKIGATAARLNRLYTSMSKHS